MVMMSLNSNHLSALNEINEELNPAGYFQVQLTYAELDNRVVVARFYKFDQPGFNEYQIDQNGAVSGPRTGGLD